jgi:hypothetical protein
MSGINRHLYLGAIALLCRVHARLSAEDREDFAVDGDPMARVAEDFNRQGFSREMVPSGPHRWALFDKPDAPAIPTPISEGEPS